MEGMEKWSQSLTLMHLTFTPLAPTSLPWLAPVVNTPVLASRSFGKTHSTWSKKIMGPDRPEPLFISFQRKHPFIPRITKAYVVAQQVKILILCCIRALAGVLTVPVLIQLQADATGRATDDDPSTWAHASHVRASDGVPVSWLQTGPPPNTEAN